MFGLPDHTMDEWSETLGRAVDLGPEHLSLYALTLEEGTPLTRDVERGATPEPDPDVAAEMYSYAVDTLARAGYVQYEISNWSKPGRECRHNLIYWRNGSWLGIGAGAHSYLGGCRFSEERSPRRYVERVQALREAGGWPDLAADSPEALAQTLKGIGPVTDVEVIPQSVEMGETMMLGLRLLEGVSEAGFARRFGKEMAEVYGPELRDLESLGLLENVEGRWRLTSRGRLLGNEVFLRFVSVTA